LHEKREVPRNDAAADPNGLSSRIAEVVAVDWYRVSHDLIGPPGIVAVALNDEMQVNAAAISPSHPNGLAVVERFELLEELPIALNEMASLSNRSRRNVAELLRQGDPTAKAFLAAATALSTSSQPASWT